ncbi:MAG: glycosyltransferase [Bergeyella sp.]|nr:glycosyltransferase [Bergeyella sp.]
MLEILRIMSSLVSIVVPVYNVEKFIERCLFSVVQQTYKDIECILVNDNTPDSSMALAEKFISNHDYPFFKIVNLPTNLGLSEARNRGIDEAKGQYIYFLDGDDAIFPQAIEGMVNLAENTKADLVVGQSICINEAEKWEKDYFPSMVSQSLLEGNRNIFSAFVDGLYPVMACDKLVRLDFIRKNALYFVKDLFSQDVLWSFQSALRLQKIAFLRESTYRYYFHEDSIIHNRGEKHFKNWISIAQYIDKAYRENKNTFYKNLILRYLVGFKSQTLEMNWKAQKNEELWKSSYKAYKKLKSLTPINYLSPNFSFTSKKQDFFTSLPVGIGFFLFRYRYGR